MPHKKKTRLESPKTCAKAKFYGTNFMKNRFILMIARIFPLKLEAGILFTALFSVYSFLPLSPETDHRCRLQCV